MCWVLVRLCRHLRTSMGFRVALMVNELSLARMTNLVSEECLAVKQHCMHLMRITEQVPLIPSAR